MGSDVPLQTIGEQFLNDGTTGVRYMYYTSTTNISFRDTSF